MSRLIDADELVTILDEELQKDSSLSKVLLVGFAKQILNDAPTVDAVEVVRCKECKYLQESGHCDKLSLWIGNKEDGGCDDFFCGYGEPREVME